MSNPCPVCQVGRLRETRTVYVRVYEGTIVSVPNVETLQCDFCGTAFYDPETIRSVEVMIGEAGPPPNHFTPPAAPATHKSNLTAKSTSLLEQSTIAKEEQEKNGEE